MIPPITSAALCRLAALSAFAGILLLGGPVPHPAGADEVQSHPFFGEKAPSFRLQTVAGDSVSLDSLKGSFVVVHFAATW